MRVIKTLPPDLFTLLIDLGPRCLVLLEGDTDFHAFSEWFLESVADLVFHVPGGARGRRQGVLERGACRKYHKAGLWHH